MNKNKVSISESVCDLVASRDEILRDLNDEIFNLIYENIVVGIEELCELPHDSIEWLDVDITEYEGDDDNEHATMKITFAMNYFSYSASPYVLETFGYDKNDKEIENSRIIVLGFPLKYCDATKREVQQFVLEYSKRVKFIGDAADVSTTDADVDFDLSDLTEEQKQQLILYNKPTGLQ